MPTMSNPNVSITLQTGPIFGGAVPSPTRRPAPRKGLTGLTVQKFDCGIHSLTYEAIYAGCPACEAEREADTLRRAVQETSGALKMLHEKVMKLEGWWDLSISMGEATPLLDDEDMAFFKSVLYQFRDEKSVSLKVTHGAALKKKRGARTLEPNGFVVIPRRGDPYGHVCSSVGGLAIAGYYDEAANSYGALHAMGLLLRAMAPHLPGGKK